MTACTPAPEEGRSVATDRPSAVNPPSAAQPPAAGSPRLNTLPPTGSSAARATADLAAYCADPTAPWPPGWRVHYLAETDSTQDLARAAAATGAPHGSVWLADYQRAGRGRRGPAWVAPPGSALLFSVLVRDCRLAPFAQIAAASLALCETLEGLGLAPRIKWPNDVLVRDRKVAGLLAERAGDASTAYTVVGIGLNVTDVAGDTPLPPTATMLDRELAAAARGQETRRGGAALASLGDTLAPRPLPARECAGRAPSASPPAAGSVPAREVLPSPEGRGVGGEGTPRDQRRAGEGAPSAAAPLQAPATPYPPNRALDRGPLLAALLARLAAHLARPALAWETLLYGQWLARLWRHQQTVRLASDDDTLEGQVVGATVEGALLLRLPDGQLRRITTGDVLLQ